MSGISGIFSRKGMASSPILLRSMTEAILHRGRDGITHWTKDEIALGFNKMANTPEAVYEKQPMFDAESGLCLVFDGRVDNRKELIDQLSIKGFSINTNTDAEIILRAYQCWGADSPNKIIGDFAYAIWNSKNKQLFCARDIVGVRPFFYYMDHSIFAFASELQQLLKLPYTGTRPNEGMLAEHLSWHHISKNETLLHDISRLPSSCHLTVGINKEHLQDYWTPEQKKQITYKDDSEYTEHFNELFKEAVRCRLRIKGKVGAELSGGLDSSAIVGMVQSQCSDLIDQNKLFETFTLVDNKWKQYEEKEYVEAVLQQWEGIKQNSCEIHLPVLQDYQKLAAKGLDWLEHPNGLMQESIRRAAVKKGINVILSGAGGDNILDGGGSYCYADHLRRLDLRGLLQSIRTDGWTIPEMIRAPEELGRFLLLPFLSFSLKEKIRYLIQSNKMPDIGFVTPEFAIKTNLADRLREKIDWYRFPTFAGSCIAHSATSGPTQYAMELTERGNAYAGLEHRYPFWDRRLMEFCLSLPDEQRYQNGLYKILLRKSATQYLPEQVRQRTCKGEFIHVYDAFILNHSTMLNKDLNLSKLGWINSDSLQSAHNDWKSSYLDKNKRNYYNLNLLWMILSTEIWYTSTQQM